MLGIGEPSFSPDDQRVAYTMLGSTGHAAYVSNVRGGPPLRLSADGGDQRGPSWSPDGGNWLAFLALTKGHWALMKTQSGGGDKAVPGPRLLPSRSSQVVQARRLDFLPDPGGVDAGETGWNRQAGDQP